MTDRTGAADRLREAALWVGAVLGACCLLLAAAGWIFGIRPLVFRSGSMSPTIPAGALALAHDVPATEVDIGDVVSVIDRDGERVTHRVVALDRSGDQVTLRLQGDANPVADDETHTVDEVQRVVADVPWGGHLITAAASPWGLLLCGGFVTLLLVTAFGRRGADGDPDGDGSEPTGPRPGRGADRKAATAAVALAVGVFGAAVAPVSTLATFSDSSRVPSGAFTPVTVPVPTSPTCASSGLFTPGVDIAWNHVRSNVTYVFEVRRRSDGGVVSRTPITPTVAVGSRQTIVVNPNTFGIGGNADYNGYIQTSLAGWTSGYTAAIRFRSGPANQFVYCGWLF